PPNRRVSTPGITPACPLLNEGQIDAVPSSLEGVREINPKGKLIPAQGIALDWGLEKRASISDDRTAIAQRITDSDDLDHVPTRRGNEVEAFRARCVEPAEHDVASAQRVRRLLRLEKRKRLKSAAASRNWCIGVDQIHQSADRTKAVNADQ